MQALVTSVVNGLPSAEVLNIQKPVPQDDELLVKVHAVALNPVDALYVAHPISTKADRVVGSDFAGVVEAVGANVTGFSVGDRVASFVQGACSSNDRPGAFAEWATTPADLAFKIPANTPFEEAASVPLCALTSAQALYQRMGIPTPFKSNAVPASSSTNESPAILIYGAATTLGFFAINLLKLSRTTSGAPYRIFGTASARNHEALLALGVEAVVDYASPTWPAEILKLSGGVSAAFNCISEGDTTGLISETFGPSGGPIAVIRGPKAWDASGVRAGVVPAYGAVWTGLGVEIGYNGAILPSVPASREFSRSFYDFLAKGATDDSTRLPISGPKIRIMPGGLSQSIVTDGFELLGSGTVGGRAGGKGRTEEWMKPISAEKMVYQFL